MILVFFGFLGYFLAMGKGEYSQGMHDCLQLILLLDAAAKDPSVWPELLQAMDGIMEHTCKDSESSKWCTTLLEPHLDRTIALQKNLTNLTHANIRLLDVLNRLPIAIILVDVQARPVVINKLAEALLAQHKDLHLHQGILATRSSKKNAILYQLIRDCICKPSTDAGGSLRIDEGGNRQAGSLWISRPENSTKGDYKDVLVALYIVSPLIHPEVSIEFLQQEYNLTHAEAKLAKSMANGCHCLSEAAKDLGVSTHTVRSQIKSIFHKTHTSSQLELIKKVLSLPSNLVKRQPASVSNRQAIGKVNPASLCLTMRLPCGRRLSWAEYGDPDGAPVFLLHGFFASRLQYISGHEVAMRLGLRILVPDRPGIGQSDLCEHDSVSDYVDDLDALSRHLRLSRFSLLGHIAGVAYCMAYACRFPENVHKTVLVSGRGFTERCTSYIGIDAIVMKMARHTPRLLSKFFAVMLTDIRKDPMKKLERRVRELSAPDQRFIQQHPELCAQYATSIREAMWQGTEGVAADMIAVMRPWGYQPADIRGKVSVWHGNDDLNVPVDFAYALADELVDCDLHIVAGVGSCLLADRWQEILQDVMA